MAMPERDNTIEELKRTDALLEYAVRHGEEEEADRHRRAPRCTAGNGGQEVSMGGNIWTERFTMAFRIVTFIVITAIISGCRYANTRVENDAPGPCKAIYADADYISYRTSEWLDNEDAVHGIDHVEVWTVSKRTGKRLKAEDIIPASRRTQVLDGMQKAITVKLDGNLLCPVFLTDNCCIAADGVHFVFNEYVIAPFVEGVVEAVVGQDGKISVTQYGNTPKFAE